MNLKKQINEIFEVKKFNKMIRNFIKNLDPNNPEDKTVINYLNSLKFNLKDTILYNFTKNLFKKMIITTEIRYRQIQSLSEEEKRNCY